MVILTYPESEFLYHSLTHCYNFQMYFSTTVALAALPFLVGAVPTQNSARRVLSIPLSKRSTLSNTDGAVNVQNLQASVHHTTTFVFLFLFEEDGSLTKHLGNSSKDSKPSKRTPENPTPLRRSKGIRTSAAVVAPSLLRTTTMQCGMGTYLLVLLPPHILVGHHSE